MKGRRGQFKRPSHFKTVAFAIEAVKANEAGTEAEFTGYASVFGNKDLGGDTVMPGAFTKTLQDQQGRVPLLKDHDFTLDGRLGLAYCAEDDRGLLVKGHINLETKAGQETYSHLKQAQQHGDRLGMSFGYSIPQGKARYNKERQTRELLEVKLYEVTITQFPMNPEAGVEDVKASFDEYFERYRERRQMHAEYTAIEDARYMAIEDALFYTDDSKEDRMARLGSTLDAYTMALTDWAGRYLDMQGVKAEDFKDAEHTIKSLHEDLRAVLAGRSVAPVPVVDAAPPSVDDGTGRPSTPTTPVKTREPEEPVEPQPPDALASDEQPDALLLKQMLASLQSVNQAA